MDVIKGIVEEIVNLVFGNSLRGKAEDIIKNLQISLKANDAFQQLLKNTEFRNAVNSQSDPSLHTKNITKIFMSNIFSYNQVSVDVLIDNYGIENEENKVLFRTYYDVLESITFKSFDSEFCMVCSQLKRINNAIEGNNENFSKLINEVRVTFCEQLDSLKEVALKTLEIYENEFWRYILCLVDKYKKKPLIPLIGRQQVLNEIYFWINRAEKNSIYQKACLVGNAGSGKTRIAQELVKDGLDNGIIIYVGYSDIDILYEKIKHHNGIILYSNCIFIFDYIYEKLSKINAIITIIQDNCGCFKVGFMTIERDTSEDHLVLVGKRYTKFDLNRYNQLGVDDFSKIIENTFKFENEEDLPDNLRQKCNELANSIKLKLNDTRPILAVLIGKIYKRDYYENHCETNLTQYTTLQSLLEQYWEDKCTESRLLHKFGLESSEDVRELRAKCDKLVKILVFIKAVTGINKLEILFSKGKTFQKEDIICSDADICDFIWENAFNELNGLSIDKHIIKKCIYYFLKDNAISTSRSGFEIIVQYDLLIEWIFYDQYIEKEDYEQWITRLLPILMKSSYKDGFLSKIYRADKDFPNITTIISAMDFAPYEDSVFVYTKRLIESKDIDSGIGFYEYLISNIWATKDFKDNKWLQKSFENKFIRLFSDYKRNTELIEGNLGDYILIKKWETYWPGADKPQMKTNKKIQ